MKLNTTRDRSPEDTNDEETANQNYLDSLYLNKLNESILIGY